ncbi:hypothetical protein PR048_015199 [Dryococelus australis]|uniref:Uncharacterized protein n=1 Tax=Dryococelus australis TaxID=614101 RepID=A0ABQ9HGS4_9NEOP|nr:hypothetical protein PR048_015199 [Dryococelus australis]
MERPEETHLVQFQLSLQLFARAPAVPTLQYSLVHVLEDPRTEIHRWMRCGTLITPNADLFALELAAAAHDTPLLDNMQLQRRSVPPRDHFTPFPVDTVLYRRQWKHIPYCREPLEGHTYVTAIRDKRVAFDKYKCLNGLHNWLKKKKKPEICVLIGTSVCHDVALATNITTQSHLKKSYGRVEGRLVIQPFILAVVTTVAHGSIPSGSLPDFRTRESCRTMPLVGGFSRGSPVSPSSALKTSMLSAAQISSLTTVRQCVHAWIRTGRTPRRVHTGRAIRNTDRACRTRRRAVAERLPSIPRLRAARRQWCKECQHLTEEWRMDSHSGGPGFDSRYNHPDFGFPRFPESATVLGWFLNKGHGRFLLIPSPIPLRYATCTVSNDLTVDETLSPTTSLPIHLCASKTNHYSLSGSQDIEHGLGETRTAEEGCPKGHAMKYGVPCSRHEGIDAVTKQLETAVEQFLEPPSFEHGQPEIDDKCLP